MKYILLIVLLIILYASNPAIEAHQNAVKSKLSHLIKQQTATKSNDNTTEKLGKAFIGYLGESFADQIVNEYIKRKDYFFFSLTTIEFKGNEKIIGVGLFGNVFISDELENELNKDINKIKSTPSALIDTSSMYKPEYK